MAAAAVEWAESHQRRGQSRAALPRWLALAVVIVCGATAILFAADGDPLVATLNALIALVYLGHLTLNPMVRPQSVARSLKASKEVVASRQ
jgi:hypothetical protein